MTVLENRGNNGSGDMFPIGMRVLAVDNDPTCLKILEHLLIICQYHVTTTNQAIKALEMLRENKDQFDLIISEVQMPDMDGFKLLELVRLEMDLPVIMLSANGETQEVMKVITHGACDYLLKPVRIKELKNIWQHVIRKRKHESRDVISIDNSKECNYSQLASGVTKDGPSDQSAQLKKERKEQDDDENEDPSSPKKQTAVNHLGLEKAVPKRILNLMNVEGLTREDVASHFQKYRLCLKRLSAVANQHANMAAALRGRDTSLLATPLLAHNLSSVRDDDLLFDAAKFPNGFNVTGYGVHDLEANVMIKPLTLKIFPCWMMMLVAVICFLLVSYKSHFYK